MDKDTRIHDLTMLLVKETVSEFTPESIANAYEDLLPKVEEAFRNHPNNKPKQAKVHNRRDLGL